MTSSVAPQIVFVTVCALLILAGPVWAQSPRLLTTFGPCIEHFLEYRPLGVCVIHGETRPVIAVLSHEQPFLRFYRMNDRAELANAGDCNLSGPQQQVVPVESDGTTQEYATLSTDGNVVTIVHSVGPSFQQRSYRVQANAQCIAISDINNDGFKDILIFGRSMTGVATLLGRGNGVFMAGPLLFPEISVSDLATADLNGDGIVDVVLLDWLSNRLMLFYGISRGVFSEQVSLSLPGEPRSIAIGQVTRQRTLRIAVSLPQDRQIALVTADATGEMDIDGTVDCPGNPLGVVLGLVNEDPWPDMIVPTDRGLFALAGTAQGDFTQGSVFGPGRSTSSICLADLDGDRRPDVVCADAARQRLWILGNAHRTGHVSWPDVYAVGAGPGGVIVHDLDGDGRPDICVANSGSASVSFLLNRGEGRFDGQISASVPENPTMVTVARRKTIETLITTHPTAEKLGVLTLEESVARTEMFALPTASMPSVIFAREDESSGGLVILVRNSSPGNGSQSLSLFEQLGSGQFLERSLRANLPQRIIALTVGYFSRSRNLDLAFVTNDRKSRQSTISLAHGSPDFDFSGAQPLFSYSDSLASTRVLLSTEINNDPYPDLLLVKGPPASAIAIAYGRGDGTFGDTLQWIENVHPARVDETVITDVDGDGVKDLVFLDDVQNAIVYLSGTGDGRFSRPKQVIPSKGVTGFAVAPLRTSRESDLVLSRGESGTIQLIFAPFKRIMR